MINLMYLVFIGMLALNVSTEVLDGFELVEESLLRSVKSSTQHNERIFADLENFFATNPEKSKEWYEKGVQVKAKTDSLFDYTQDLKNRIVIKSDGKNGDPEHLRHPDDLNAAYEIMFERGKNDGAKLKSNINNYRDYVTSLVANSSIKNIIENNLSTEPSDKAKENKQSWEESMFFQMPVAAAVTLLTKLQNDIRYAEGEVLSDLVKNIDVTDSRVNKIEAFVIPQTYVVMRGDAFRANIGMSAQDSTQTPHIFVNGRDLPESANGQYTAGASSTGTFPVSGYVEMPRGDGSVLRRDFSMQYFVVEPSATVAPVLMNVLYAGIENEIRIAVPGIASQNISATMTNGSLSRKNDDIWVAKPSAVGTDAVVSVVAKMTDGHSLEMAKSPFRVRALPNPSPYLTIPDPNGTPMKFDGGRQAKAALNNVTELFAAIDDGLLNIRFTVLRFETVYFDSMGNSIREPSEGAHFSARQKDMIRQLTRGQTLLIRGVVARGPDGSERTLKSVMEIIIN
jgi:gliding motility-associated protein GldM